MIATLFNVPHTPELLAQFSFANQDSHRQIIRAVLAQKNTTLQEGIVDPIPLDQIATWGNVHQAMHNQMNSALGLSGNDLSDVDFRQPAQIEAWIQLHAREHRAAENALGIG